MAEGVSRQDHPITSLQYLPSASSEAHRLVSVNVKGELSITTVESSVEGLQLTSDFARAKIASAPATSLDVQSDRERVVTVAEDGMYAVWDAQTGKFVVEPTQASESCLNCVRWISHDSFVTASHSSDIQVWDVRTSTKEPVRALVEEVEQGDVAKSTDRRVWSVDNNPARPWLLGSSVSGPSQELRPTIMFHDLRAAPQPALINSSLHTGHIWKMQFHPQHPDHVVTASDDGTLLLWDTTSAFEATATLKPTSINGHRHHSKHQNVKRLRNDGLPINHFQIDSHHNLVISSSDAESITFNSDLF